jgi:hypothetical protein
MLIGIDASSSYTICLSTNNTGWYSHERAASPVHSIPTHTIDPVCVQRVHFDMAVGDTDDEELHGEGGHGGRKLSEMVMRVRDLNHRISDIKREQAYQRVRNNLYPSDVFVLHISFATIHEDLY